MGTCAGTFLALFLTVSRLGVCRRPAQLFPVLDAFSHGVRGPRGNRVLPGERSGRLAPGRSLGPVRFSFSRLFYIRFFFFFDFSRFYYNYLFCEGAVKMYFLWFWLFSAVFLCGRFQYGVRNRWNSAVFVFSTVFVWTIPVCVIITKAISVTFACTLP